MSNCEFKICGERLHLLAEKAIFWKKENTIIISDLHLGKAGHFRKHGIPVSGKIHFTDLKILESLLHQHKPAQVILLGDLFHSAKNNEWNDFLRFLEIFDIVKFILVKGNHDIMEEYPAELNMVESLDLPPFNFTHQRESSELYNLSGHIHPGFRVRGIAREGLTLPCFYFSSNHGVLPAFGQFTGIKKIKPLEGDKIFGIADDNVMELI
ncbi:MAG: ligase-associated DNA damage response endonuclease PdeM [Cyclobacteriaceae bacterium]